MTDELEQMSPNQRRALDKALSALETFASIWAAEIRLSELSARIAAVPTEAERAKRIAAMIEQGFIEGAYRHYLDHNDKCDELAILQAATRDDAQADHYAAAFYEIAKALGIGARSNSPKAVFENEMLPMIKGLVDAPEREQFVRWWFASESFEYGHADSAWAAWQAACADTNRRNALRWQWARDTGMLGAEDETFVDAGLRHEQAMPGNPLQAATRDTASQAAQDVLAERQRQVTAEGWTPEHDDEHEGNQLSMAAACYALEGVAPYTGYGIDVMRTWSDTGWSWAWWKPKGRRRNLVKAGALIIAEIERIDRAAIAASAPKEFTHRASEA